MIDLATRIRLASPDKPHMFFAGQAGFIFRSATGTLLGVDLYLSDCVESAEGNDGYKRLTPKLLEPGDVDFNYLIATHPHYDHFDKDAIPGLMQNGRTQLYASANCSQEVERLQPAGKVDKTHVHYVRVGDSARLDDIAIDFVPCDHGQAAPDAFGLVIVMDGRRIYIAGDTCLRLDIVPGLLEKGPFDYMIAPINGAFGNLNESECVQLAAAINPGCVIPCHYGMFAAHGGSPGLFREEMISKLPEQDYLLVAPSEAVAL